MKHLYFHLDPNNDDDDDDDNNNNDDGSDWALDAENDYDDEENPVGSGNNEED